ncbi:type I-E CRISPR-associated protein Cas6/Cse3/CasE [Actinopolyspora erythraea]|uniref:type I-E CRISPR-associated protein Cas6/Cse3/CasE n=1 Tax=Actinopolyspora erythraea TaxID=414996 RepID=UPI0012FE3720|nr:type I-E CRISPR-associated protein Cas6/Cse3/CasE [Actinopolyspora erythraea]
MTLTRLVLNPAHREVASDVADVQRMHERVMSMFPDDLGEHARWQAGVLYRVEHSAAPVVLVQSTITPDPAALPSGYAEVKHRELGSTLENLETGVKARFRIVANPTRIETDKKGGKHRRVLTGDNALEWWQRRAEQAGLELSSVMLTHEGLLTGNRPAASPRNEKLYHGTAQFDGLAVVADAEKVRQALLEGIGRAKAYGCGLLSLVPVKGGS